MFDTDPILLSPTLTTLNSGLGTALDFTQSSTGINALLSTLALDQGAASNPFNAQPLVTIDETSLNPGDSLFLAGGGVGALLPNQSLDTTVHLLTGNAAGDSLVGGASTLFASQTAATKIVPGVFTVGQTGQISIDLLAESGAYQSQVGIFSVTGMENLEPGSLGWFQEAQRRVLSNSEQGRIVISDASEGARFSGELGERNWNDGDYKGVKTFNFRPGDQVAFMFMPNGSFDQPIDSATLQSENRPLVSMTIGSTPGVMVDITGDGLGFGFEDSTDQDYNDLVFKAEGLTGYTASLEDVINPDRDWLGTDMGQTIDNHVSPQSPPPSQGEPIVYPIDPVTGARYAPGELLVQFKSTATEAEIQSLIQTVGASSVKLILSAAPEDGEGAFYQLTFEATADLQAVGITLQQSNQVESTKLNYVLSNQYSPYTYPYSWYTSTSYDAYVDDLWGLDNYGQTWGTYDADIDAPEAWELQTGSRSVVVAILDTGVDYRHRDLRANIWRNRREIAGNGFDDDGNGYVDDIRGYDFANNDNNPMDWDGHGTHVAGTIGAVRNNGIGVVGVSPNVSLMPVRVLGPDGGFDSDIARGIDYAVRMGAKIINASLGGGAPTRVLYEAIRRANNAGVLFVAAAGNDGTNNDFFPHYPSDYDLPNIISVTATDHNDRLHYNYGVRTVDMAAPGVDILSTVPGNDYDYKSGTSMAAPHVAGAAALLLAEDPTLTPTELKSILMNTADFTYDLWGNTVSGGRLNVNNALRSLNGYWGGYWNS